MGKQNAPVKRMLGIESRLRKISLPENTALHLLTPPPVLSVNWLKSPSSHMRFLDLNASIVRKSILKAMRKMDIKSPVVINAFNPFIGLPLINKLNELATIYYCYDEINACEWTKNHGKRLEEIYLGKVDAAIVTSDGLLQSKSKLVRQSYLVKNGVDFTHFNKASELRLRNRNSDIIVGYVGSVDKRIDFELLTALATKLPDIKFEFVGRIMETEKANILDKLPNIKFWGAKKVEELPNFIKNFDAGIIPFIKNELTAGIYPIKVNEYLASGIPVITTDFAPLPEFGSTITTASDHNMFLQAVIENLTNDTREKRKERMEVAHSNSWENRALQFGEAIQDVLESKMNTVQFSKASNTSALA
jgi:glycosyltransferase involved in cell wall biosynthesis